MYTSNVVNTFLSILSIFYNNTFSHLLRLKVYPSIKTTTDHDGLHVAFSAAENIHYMNFWSAAKMTKCHFSSRSMGTVCSTVIWITKLRKVSSINTHTHTTKLVTWMGDVSSVCFETESNQFKRLDHVSESSCTLLPSCGTNWPAIHSNALSGHRAWRAGAPWRAGMTQRIIVTPVAFILFRTNHQVSSSPSE